MTKVLTHLTDIRNLASMCGCSAIYCTNTMNSQQIQFIDSSNSSVQAKRSRTIVPCGPGGTLHDYVPFFFNPKSPMLYKLCRYPDPGSTTDRRSIIQLVTTVDQVISDGLGYVFTDGHAIVDLTEFYDDVADLDKVDWGVMDAVYWRDTDEDMDKSRRRMAEFLIYREIPLTSILEIATYSRVVANQASQILEATGVDVPVKVRSNWYY